MPKKKKTEPEQVTWYASQHQSQGLLVAPEDKVVAIRHSNPTTPEAISALIELLKGEASVDLEAMYPNSNNSYTDTAAGSKVQGILSMAAGQREGGGNSAAKELHQVALDTLMGHTAEIVTHESTLISSPDGSTRIVCTFEITNRLRGVEPELTTTRSSPCHQKKKLLT